MKSSKYSSCMEFVRILYSVLYVQICFEIEQNIIWKCQKYFHSVKDCNFMTDTMLSR